MGKDLVSWLATAAGLKGTFPAVLRHKVGGMGARRGPRTRSQVKSGLRSHEQPVFSLGARAGKGLLDLSRSGSGRGARPRSGRQRLHPRGQAEVVLVLGS